MTISPGGSGMRTMQSARLPFESVCCMAYASDGKALETMACNWISPNMPRVCLLESMSCSDSMSLERLVMVSWALSMVLSLVRSSPSDSPGLLRDFSNCLAYLGTRLILACADLLYAAFEPVQAV